MIKTSFLILFVILISVGVTSAYAINITLGGTVDITQILNMMGNRITNVGEPVSSTDAATKGYVDQSPTTDTLAVLGCTTDQIAKFNGTVWICANPSLDSLATYIVSGTSLSSSDRFERVSCDSGDKVLTNSMSPTPIGSSTEIKLQRSTSASPNGEEWEFGVSDAQIGTVFVSISCIDLPPLRP